MTSINDHIQSAQRVVIKVGSGLLIDEENDNINQTWLADFVADIAHYHSQKKEILLICSGSIALGRRALNLSAHKDALKLEEKQAAAATGQILLSHAWHENFAQHDMSVAQILLTYDDTETRRRNYLNARNTLLQLLKFNAIPVINENDTVATDEIRYGDNDRLAARVAVMMEADLLIILSDIDGLYRQNPFTHKDAEHVPLIASITPEIIKMAGEKTGKDGTGGMVTKIDAAKIAIGGGCQMMIANGRSHHPLMQSEAKYSLFTSDIKPQTARKQWIGAGLDVKGELQIDEGAKKALHQGNSLLAAGVVAVMGEFTRGALLAIKDKDGVEIGRGLVAYGSDDAKKIIGKHSDEFEKLIGYKGATVLMHRDNLSLFKNI